METDLILQPNIGKDTTNKLIQVGIYSIADLRNTGTEQAFLRLQSIDPGACIHLLYGIDAAISGIPSNSLTEERKNELKLFHRMCKKELKQDKK